MPQDQEALEKEWRRQMRAGRTPLVEACRDTFQTYLIAMKGWQRKNAELRESVGILSSDFSVKGKRLRETARNAQEGGSGTVDLYKELAKQAKAVSTLIDKELPNLIKLYEPVGELYVAYEQATAAYEAYMAQWQGKLPQSDLNGRSLELALDQVERSLR